MNVACFPDLSVQVCLLYPPPCSLTIWEFWVSELKVFTASCGVVLRAHRVLHALDVLFEIIQRAEDVLHALSVVQHGAHLVRLHVDGATGLLGHVHRQRLDDLTRRTLRNEKMSVYP